MGDGQGDAECVDEHDSGGERQGLPAAPGISGRRRRAPKCRRMREVELNGASLTTCTHWPPRPSTPAGLALEQPPGGRRVVGGQHDQARVPPGQGEGPSLDNSAHSAAETSRLAGSRGQSGLTGIEPAYGNQDQAEVADLVQQPAQGGLIGHRAGDDRLAVVTVDLQALEPGLCSGLFAAEDHGEVGESQAARAMEWPDQGSPGGSGRLTGGRSFERRYGGSLEAQSVQVSDG